MAEATVCFCVGATKAGSGWLYEYLADHPECHFRSIKELHYFDALENGTLDREIAKHEDRRAIFEKKLARAQGEAAVDLAIRLRDRTEWLKVLGRGKDAGAYLSYLNAGRDGEKVVGDITPAYSLLPDPWLAEMAGIAPQVRFVYVLRDPVARAWSHIRMMAARREPSGEVTPERAARILRRTLRGDERQIALRSDYAGNLTRLTRNAGDKLLVVFYEELFDGPALDQICDHLGIAQHPGRPEDVVHEGQALPLLPEQRLMLREWLAPQYRAIGDQLGRLPQAWG